MTTRFDTRFDTETAIGLAQATDIARELGHQEVGPDHLLLGLLANPRGTAYAALHDHGLDFATARDLVAEHHVADEAGRDHRHDDAARGGHHEPARYDEDRAALRAVGIDLDRVRDAVRANLGADLAEEWGGRRHHRPGRGHGAGRDRGRSRDRRGARTRRDGPHYSHELRALLRGSRGRGQTGPKLLVALLDSEDPGVRAVLERATGLDGLRAQAEAAAGH